MNIHTDLPLKKKTLIMGIVNVTPDSFSDGGRYLDPAAAVAHGMRLVRDGADLLDLGAESTRPGSEPVPADKQVQRLKPVVGELLRQTNVPLSIDTTQARVAREMLDLGAHMVNDISGLQFDSEMGSVVAERNCPVVIMHILNTPKNMQHNPQYTDVIEEIREYFIERIEWAHHAGITDQQIILDPGIGFGKTVEHNYRIVGEVGRFASLGYPVLLGASRKSFIGRSLDLPVGERLEGSLAAAVVGAWEGADILRVHDVKETVRAIRLTDAIQRTRVTTH